MNPDNGLGPPGPEVGEGGPSQPADVDQGLARSTPATSITHGLATMGRRRRASRRLPPLTPCGCIRDPLTDRHRCDGEISDKMAQAAVAAIHTLDALGTPGLLDRETCEAIHRLGYRRWALDVHRRSTGHVVA